MARGGEAGAQVPGLETGARTRALVEPRRAQHVAHGADDEAEVDGRGDQQVDRHSETARGNHGETIYATTLRTGGENCRRPFVQLLKFYNLYVMFYTAVNERVNNSSPLHFELF